MDVVAHGLWTFVTVYILSQWNVTARYFNTTKKLIAAVIAGFGIDLLFAPQFFYITSLTFKTGKSFYELAPGFPEWFYSLYYVHHNYFFIALIALILYFKYREYTVPITFALVLHVTSDIFTHKNVFELKPFWPIQQEVFHGLVSWGDPVFFKWSWTLLIVSIALVLFHMQYENRKNMINRVKRVMINKVKKGKKLVK